MIKKETQEIQCDHCKNIFPIKTNLKKWSSRQHILKLANVSKHFCPVCTKTFGFYNNGVTIFK